MKQNNTESILKLLEIMAQLRDPHGGCPWDQAQRFETIAPHTIEEAYEVADAIERGAFAELRSELGDLLFQVVFHARIAEEDGHFSFSDVAQAISDKLVSRHPHVFANGEIPADQSADWESRKQAERSAAGDDAVLAGIPIGLPALTRAAKLGKRASAVGFDWPDSRGARAKIDEELAELDAACSSGEASAIEAEAGDLLFALVNLCRHLKIDPEQALRGTNRRFEKRFAGVEHSVAQDGRDWSQHALEELERYWQAAKSDESA